MGPRRLIIIWSLRVWLLRAKARSVFLVVNESIRLNLCCTLSHENDLFPFTEYHTLQGLLALRYQPIVEQGQSSQSSFEPKLTYLSFKLFDSLIPPDVLQSASFVDIAKYRRETRDKYEQFRNYGPMWAIA